MLRGLIEGEWSPAPGSDGYLYRFNSDGTFERHFLSDAQFAHQGQWAVHQTDENQAVLFLRPDTGGEIVHYLEFVGCGELHIGGSRSYLSQQETDDQLGAKDRMVDAEISISEANFPTYFRLVESVWTRETDINDDDVKPEVLQLGLDGTFQARYRNDECMQEGNWNLIMARLRGDLIREIVLEIPAEQCILPQHQKPFQLGLRFGFSGHSLVIDGDTFYPAAPED